MIVRPIIFSGTMVRALLDGRKTQTRRLATSPLRRCRPGHRLWVRENCAAEELCRPPRTVKATPRERLALGRTTVIQCDERDGQDGIRYCADDAFVRIANTQDAGDAWSEAFHYGGKRPKGYRGKIIPSIHMPRWASRIMLRVEDVRIEPLQEITDEGAIAEGIVEHEKVELGWHVPGVDHPNKDFPVFSRITAREMYAALWDTLHGSGEWLGNPEVLVIGFTVEQRNVDRIAA